ncbi:MAG: hypothetical protein IJG38_06225 [Thermoguttaceae bacterium]|nr:hypothetical protein [Thermoguttaceae bacterium]
MNFIMKYRRSNLHSRRGMILLVVMAVLSFFAVMGMTFILMTGKNRDSAETAQLAAQNSKTAGNSPQELLEEGIMQVLVGPPDGNTVSALLDCDLIGDMYGGASDSNLEKVTASFNANKMTPANAAYAGRVVTIADGPYKGQSTLILNSRGAIVPFASGIGVSEAIPSCTCVINKKRAFQGDTSKYDVADINESSKSNDFMSLRFTGGANNIKVGRVVVPSFYRGGNRPGLNANELGGTSVYSALSAASFKTAASNNASPWDIDNDGDGDNDSVWMNLGLPPRPMPDGTLVVPLYAILVEDMDGRLNLNAHSPDELVTASTAYSSLGTASVTLPEGETLDPSTMLNGQGFGPADVNLEALLGDLVSDIISKRKGNNVNSNFFKYRFPFGSDTESDGSILKTDFNVTNQYKSFRTPVDFYGVMTGVIDQNGMFVWQKRGTVGKYGLSSYERDLGSAQPKGNNNTTNAPSKPFSPEELEGVLRAYDDDSQKLESRLLDSIKDCDNKNAVRNLVTTESWDMPYCDISGAGFSSNNNLPEEILAGFKMDINRPLTSYEDNVDQADADRTQLAKDLYLIAKACVGQRKAVAQWAVNAVDFRDGDSVCTHLNIDGYDVWGCERPELLITETFAFHARMTEDSELGGWRSDDSQKCARSGAGASTTYIDAEWYDPADCQDTSDGSIQTFCGKYGIAYSNDKKAAIVALMEKVRDNQGDGIADMDQVYKPESGLFIELYNPWLSAGSQEAMPAEYNSTNKGVALGSGGSSIVDSAWRIAVAGGVANGNSGNSWAEDLREKKYTINRVLYFGSSTPESGQFTYKAGVNVCVKPGQFAIIGPTGKTNLARNEEGATVRSINITSSSVKFDSTSQLKDICIIPVPDSNNARFSVTDIGTYNDQVDNNGKLNTPRDMPYDADDVNRWTNLDGIGHGLGDDFKQPGYRVVYLQRLANPYKAYNATTNPYITFDQMPVDLHSYNGRQDKFADYKNLSPGKKAGDADQMDFEFAKVFLNSRQRGETQAVSGSSVNFWSAEKLLGVTTSLTERGRSLTLAGNASASAAMKNKFYNSMAKFDPFDSSKLALVSTKVGTSTTPASLPSYKSAAPYYFPNRPFNSVMELMLVPQVSAFHLTSSDNAINKPSSADLSSGSLPNYLHPTGSDGNIDFLTEAGSKIFDYVRVQTPFVVTPMNVNTYSFGSNGSTATSNYRWSFREPGKININSITHPAVWAALLGLDSEDKANTIAGLAADMYNNYWGKAFTENPGARPRTFGSSAANYIAANYQIFQMNNNAKQCQSAANSVYFQTQLMQRLSNLTTTRSNVFAVWVTVGFFEYQGGNIGKEYGLDNGSRQRYRAFYIIDRTRPVGYSPGKRMNADKTIILRRYLP